VFSVKEMLDMQDFSSVNPNQAGEAFEANTMDHRVLSEAVSRNTSEEVRKPQQKFKSRHFPEPFWGHDD
jgi:hypothetical protein